MKKLILGISLFLFSFMPAFAQTEANEEYLKGKIVNVVTDNGETRYSIEIFEGSLESQTIEYSHNFELTDRDVDYEIGDKVVVSYIQSDSGEDIFQITDHWRVGSLNVLLLIFVLLSIVVAGKKSLYSIIAMLLSFVVIFSLVLPGILGGTDPVLIAILGSMIIVPITFYLSHGFNRKTSVAIVGTIIALIVTGLLSVLFVNWAHLYGYSAEEVLYLNGSDLNLKGILLAGIIIGALGVLDDITISQSAIVFEMIDMDGGASPLDIFFRSMKIGKDHIASMINTLVLVYAGASLPLLLLFVNDERNFLEIVNMESISTEIVRTLVGSIGLMLAVPVTTFIACWWNNKKTEKG